MVNLLIIIGIIYSVFYVFSVGGLLLLFFRKDIKFSKRYALDRNNLVKAIFIMPNFTLKTEYVVHDDKDQFDYDKGKYNVDKKSGLFSGRKDTSMFKNIFTQIYQYGNPNPISFKTIGKDTTIPYTDAEAFKIAMEQKFIKDLMKEAKTLLLVLLFVAVVGILVVVNIGITWIRTKSLVAGVP